MTIGGKILWILVVPFIGLLVLAGLKIAADQASWQTAQETEKAAVAASQISTLIHQLQLERGLTSGFLTSKGRQFAEALAKQRPLTDQAQEAVSVDQGNQSLSWSEMAEVRRSVDALSLPLDQALGAYTSAIRTLLDRVAVDATRGAGGQFSHELTAYFFFLTLKELTGQLRAVLNAGLSAGQFDPVAEQRIAAVLGLRDEGQRNFDRFASDAERTAESLLDDPAVKKADALVKGVLAAPAEGPFPVDAPGLFQAMTAKINVMKAADDALSLRLRTEASGAANQAVVSLWIDACAVLTLLVLAIALEVSLSRSIRRQLGCEPAEVAALARSIQAGVLELPPTRRGTVEGAYADLLQMVRVLTAKAEALEQVEHGNLSQSVDLASNEDRLGISLAAMVKSLRTTVLQVLASVEQLSAGAGQVAQASQILAQGATTQASAVEQLNASATEVASLADRNAGDARQASEKAQSIRQEAAAGKTTMRELLTLVEFMALSSKETKKLVKVIDDIAFQVNVLALNAAVEAARAGKFGRGFAVVAEEVRELAGRSASAVEETTKVVEQIQRSISSVLEASQRTGEKLDGIASGVAEINGTLDQIATESLAQARALAEMKSGLDQIEQVTQANTASAEQSASAAEELAGQTSELRRQVAWFRP